jgi:hypothetical protein
MIAYLLAGALSCDPALTALFTPLRPVLGRYEVCTAPAPLDEVAHAPGAPHFAPGEMIEALDAFGSAGTYRRAALATLYGGQRVRVARGWVEYADRFESVTLLSPYPDAALTRLIPGTMVIRWTVEKQQPPERRP